MSVDHDYAYAASTGKTNGSNIGQSSSQQARTTASVGHHSFAVGGAQRIQNTIVTTSEGRPVIVGTRPLQAGVVHQQPIRPTPLPMEAGRTTIQTTNRLVQQPNRSIIQQPSGSQIPRTSYVVVTSTPTTHQNMQYAPVKSVVTSAGNPQIIRTQVIQNPGQHISAFQGTQQLVGNNGQGQNLQNQLVFVQNRNNSFGMNLAIPLREPTPEPVVVKEEPLEVKEEVKEEPLSEDLAGDIDIQIRNVVCNYTLPLHIDLRRLALNSNNVTYDRGRGVMMKQKRDPNCYVKVYSSGKVYIVGCRSEIDCKRAARSIARHVQRVMGKLESSIRIRNYKVNNVLATCRLPFGIKIEELAQKYPANAQYEPELSVGLVWRSTDPKATLRIHTTGSITVTGAHSEEAVMRVIEDIWPIALEFRCMDRARGKAKAPKKRRAAPSSAYRPIKKERFDDGYEKNYSSSGVVGNKVYFSDEDDIYQEEDLDLED
ncbi:unnamed protein product [Caenorhabditis auriculariae]|uniref:TATA box-binding protein-like 1 n=1 Tax=Caenorhabditis auriculariae TaxID=2777116 RepID=A0A8S1GPE8_9PELO|nr:unnamed protein product [Caenorhabditis auriculariae]